MKDSFFDMLLNLMFNEIISKIDGFGPHVTVCLKLLRGWTSSVSTPKSAVFYSRNKYRHSGEGAPKFVASCLFHFDLLGKRLEEMTSKKKPNSSSIRLYEEQNRIRQVFVE